MKKSKKFARSLILFFIGGTVYYSLEILARGRSHYSMYIAGGLCLVTINLVCNKLKPFCKCCLAVKATIGGVLITLIELIVGVLFNLILKMSVWDYSSMPYNLLGQICLPFTFLWILLSFPALFVCKLVDNNGKNARL